MSEPSSWLNASFYDQQAKIGCGAFSNVYRARIKSKENAYVAIKIMDLEHISSSFEDILQEVQTMKMCDDPNILRCYCSFVNADQLWLVTEMMDKGSCLRLMNVARGLGMGEGMSEEWLAYILREALQGLHYLHNNGQIHRDIKPGNILVDSHGSVRLADFGVSGWTVNSGQRKDTVKTFVGTPVYMAPEVMEQAGGYDFRADIWSMGIAALELAKGVAPYAHLSAMRVLVLTIEEPPPSLRAYPNDRQRDGAPFSANFDDFYKKCLQKNPRQRPSTEELLKHKFLKNRSCYALVDQLLKHIPSVGRSVPTRPSAEEQRRRLLPGEGPVAIELIERRVDTEGGDVTGGSSSSRTDGSDGTPGKPPPSFPPSPMMSPSRDGRNPPAPPVYVSGTTWVFDGDDDHGSLNSSGEMPRILRVSSRVPGRSGSLINGQSFSMLSHSSTHSSSSSAKHDDYHNNNGIDSFLADFEADAATIKSTKSVAINPIPIPIVTPVTPPIIPTPIIPSVDIPIPAIVTPPVLPVGASESEVPSEVLPDKGKGKDTDNDAFMDEMEELCN